MRRINRFAVLSAALLASAGFSAGCNTNEPESESPAEVARQAVGIDENSGTQKTTEVSRDVLVEKTTKVVDQQTGKVISTEKEVTPVTVQSEKKVNTDVKVNVGDTTKTVD